MNNNVMLIKELLNAFLATKNLTLDPSVEKPSFEDQGHLSTNLAMVLAKHLKKNPFQIAEEIIKFLEENNRGYFDSIEVKGPGFINFYLAHSQLTRVLSDINLHKTRFGASQPKHFKYNLEIVSANPTGYLHIGHARNAAIGDASARILRFAGYDVVVEYYTNDAGNQINLLALTVFVNYLNLLGHKTELPADCYKGDIYEGAAQLFIDKYQDRFVNCTFGETKLDDPEVHHIFRVESTEYFLNVIKEQLARFRTDVEYYISEQSMYDNHLIEKALEIYREKGAVYEKDGATWLRTTDFGDDKDRVLIKSDGTYTYITPDLASHKDKMDRTRADRLVNFWGGDHHGYIKRMQAGLELFGLPEHLLEIDMIQMVRLIKNGEEFKMSKRKGTAIWLIDVLDILGVDTTRYMLSSKSPDSHMDFDIGLLEEQSSKNPVFYAQYAAARCHSIVRQAKEAQLTAADSYELLTNKKELDIMVELDLFNRVVEAAAKTRHPHIICDYIQTIAKKFHSYYNECKVIDMSHPELSAQRFALVQCVLQLLTNAFDLIGVQVKENM